MIAIGSSPLLSIATLSVLLLVGSTYRTSAHDGKENRPVIAKIKNSSVVEGCGGYYALSGQSDTSYILMVDVTTTARMNLDGSDVPLRFLGEAGQKEHLKVCS